MYEVETKKQTNKQTNKKTTIWLLHEMKKNIDSELNQGFFHKALSKWVDHSLWEITCTLEGGDVGMLSYFDHINW